MVFFSPNDLITLRDHANVSRIVMLNQAADIAARHVKQSVTDFNRHGIDSHDYWSWARYYHPNPDTPDGLPYVSRDGVLNPDALDGPKQAMIDLAHDTLCLGMAGYFIDKKYIQCAIERLNHWFLNPIYAMRPHLNHAQAIRGLNTGRPAGIIDSHIWINIIIGLDFINASGMATDEFIKDMRQWFGQFVDWLYFSASGNAARNIGNNISAWWCAIVMVFATVAGGRDRAIWAMAANGLMRSDLCARANIPDGIKNYRRLAGPAWIWSDWCNKCLQSR